MFENEMADFFVFVLIFMISTNLQDSAALCFFLCTMIHANVKKWILTICIINENHYVKMNAGGNL